MKKIIFFMAVTIICLLVSVSVYSKDDTDDKDITMSRGKAVYVAYCAVCHGSGGKGDGESAHALIPKPKDFTSPDFKATASKEKIMNSILNGRPGTQMEGWKDKLSSEDVHAVMEYIQSL